jgi:hypothetical protein
MTTEDKDIARQLAAKDLQTTNGSDGSGWVGTVTTTVTLSDDEKQILEAIARLGSFAANSDYPDELDRLEECEFPTRERVGETFTRGRPRGDGFDVYRLTETAKSRLTNCRPVEPGEAA